MSPITKPELQFPISGIPFKFRLDEAKVYGDKVATVRISLPFSMEEYFPIYNIHFVLAPTKYQEKIDSIARKLASDQMEIDQDPRELTANMKLVAEEYKDHSERLGMTSFANLPLIEYKKNPKGDSLLTFTLQIELLRFLLSDETKDIPLYCIINDINDDCYIRLDEDEKKEMFSTTRFNAINKKILY